MDNKLITQRHVITALEALESEASRSVTITLYGTQAPVSNHDNNNDNNKSATKITTIVTTGKQR
jgi:hypothetical protein